MELILKEDVANLGYKDDIVSVKRGYGRNYLIPQGKAVIATESARKILAENLRQRAHKLAEIKAAAEALAAKIDGVTVTIATKTSSTGTIFGSVNSVLVSEELAKMGFEVERKSIVIKDAIKEVGEYTAVVKLHKEVSANLNLHVISEE
ncbi:MAG: 50S ribosomal protein L9 [Paludibacteraceae bacterium]|nr:50S ribosomal protein L9 [Paludibacteraceae bacterium]